MALVEIRDVHKVFQRDSERIEIFTGLTLDVAEGSFTALMGPSGSGKSTLLNLLAGLDKPTSGIIRVAGAEVSAMTPGQLAPWRAQHIGFVFQNLNLLPVLTAYQNVELPLLLTRLSKKERDERVRLALGVVGLADRLRHYPRQLSGGQEQRVAIARAIVADPTLVLLDEPTGQLDARSSQDVLGLLQRLNDEFKKTIVVVTHDAHAADRYMALLRELKAKYALTGDMDVRSFASLPNIFVWEEPTSETDAYASALREVISKATDDMVRMKQLEGETLRSDLESRVESIRGRVAQIRERAPDRLRDARNRLRERVSLLLEDGEIPEERVAQEVAILSDRLDCTEECVRLESHCGHFRKLLDEESTPGRKLNFLLQEMNREINTIGSKSSDVPIVEQVVEVKEELERIREQVQNIE